MKPSQLHRRTGLSRGASRLAPGKPPARSARLEPGGSLPRYARIRFRSAKRRREIVPYRAAVVAAFERSAGQCEARVPDVCKGEPAEHPHEPRTRARFGLPTDAADVMPVCPRCHSWIHENDEDAEALGLLVPSWEGRGAA